MAKRTQIGERIKGTFRESEDSWYLIQDDNGTSYVEHEWCHVDPYGKRNPSSGTKKIPVDEFLASDDHSQGMKAVIRDELKKK